LVMGGQSAEDKFMLPVINRQKWGEPFAIDKALPENCPADNKGFLPNGDVCNSCGIKLLIEMSGGILQGCILKDHTTAPRVESYRRIMSKVSA